MKKLKKNIFEKLVSQLPRGVSWVRYANRLNI